MIYQDFIRVLHMDLQREKIHIAERSDLMPYLGGVGIASKLLEENMRADLPPLAPEQPIVFAIGALSTIFPVITKVVAMFISPLTGELGESYAGGRLAMTMFEAGYDAIVITGKAKRPTYLMISDDDIQFRDARTLWGQKIAATGSVIRDNEKKHSGKRSIICIGAAGENQVSYACVTVDLYRHFGRLGLGAVFGSKLIKAIHMMGERSIPIQDFKEYFKVYREIYDKCTEAGGSMAKYHDIGTPINVEPLNAAGALPTLNLRQNRFDKASSISGVAFAEKHLVRKLSCIGCPVGCIHIGQFRRAFSDTEEAHEYETVAVAYDYELIFALGSYLGISKKTRILELIDDVEEYGLDAMSTGVALGWATEALENGIISEKEALVPLRFGEPEPYRKAIQYIAEVKNDFYKHLGRGVRVASKAFGGQDYAMHVAGNETAGYHTGYGSLLGAAAGARHSHLCNGGYSFDQNLKEGTVDTDKMADSLIKEEVERCMTNSLVMCLFARKVYSREIILKALNSIGKNLTDQDLTDMARRIYATKLRIKKKLGIDLRDIKFPKRFFQTPSAYGFLEEETAYEILEKFRARTAELESTL
jgi:aldehyde:ferredoxin oxidoreductase